LDSKEYSEARRALMQQIAQRQHDMMEEAKKQQEAKAKEGATGSTSPPAKK
jgi:hypothetical protein